MGSRLLKRWLALPLKDINKIKGRHEVVAYLNENSEELHQIQYQIKQISDLERLISKVTGKPAIGVLSFSVSKPLTVNNPA